MTWNNPYFTEQELACRCGCGTLPEKEFIDRLTTIREEAGFPFIVTSGARCAAHNLALTGTEISGHVLKVAVDIFAHGEQALKIIKLALKHGMTGLGVAQKGPISDRFIHMDAVKPGRKEIPRPAIWSY